MKVYGVYQNSEPTEGRGIMVLRKLFESARSAYAFKLEQNDYPGHPMWEVRELEVHP